MLVAVCACACAHACLLSAALWYIWQCSQSLATVTSWRHSCSPSAPAAWIGRLRACCAAHTRRAPGACCSRAGGAPRRQTGALHAQICTRAQVGAPAADTRPACTHLHTGSELDAHAENRHRGRNLTASGSAGGCSGTRSRAAARPRCSCTRRCRSPRTAAPGGSAPR